MASPMAQSAHVMPAPPQYGKQNAPPSQGGILTRGRYDIALYGWFAGMDPDDSGQFLCDQRPPAGPVTVRRTWAPSSAAISRQV